MSLHVIAISKPSIFLKELEIFICLEERIYSYSSQLELEINWNYADKIKEIAVNVDKGKLEWADVWIEEGQEISYKGKDYYIDGEKIELIKRLSKEKFASIGPITAKIYNEYMRSNNKGEDVLREILRENFESELFTTKISEIVETEFEIAVEVEDLNNLDKQIIVRSKIEGYKFIINFIKNILHSRIEEKYEFCEMFFSRVFMLESQNFIRF